MEIGTIKAVHIYLHERLYVAAKLDLNVKGVNHSFGGHQIFLWGKNSDEFHNASYLGRFVFRCMQICEVQSWEELKSSKVLVDIFDGKVVAIGNIAGNKWFNPQAELEALENTPDEEAFNQDVTISR